MKKEKYDNEKTILKDALLKRATGYDYEEKIVEASKDGKPGKVKIVKKHVPPDVKAIERIMEEIRYGRW